MDLQLAGKTALITGGSRGLGKASARVLAREGVDVVLVARTLEPLQTAAAELSAETGRRVIAIPADTTDDDAVKAMASQALAAFGHIDILVNSAAEVSGFAVPPKLDGINNDNFWNDMNTKVMGYIRVARELAPNMKERRWGRIINISGLGARNSGNILGSIRNVAVTALTKNLADELGPFGINVTVVHPGTTRTEKRMETSAIMAQQRGVTIEEIEAGIASGNSLKRMIDATEIADIVAFLASPRSIAITGDVIAAGGGGGRAIYY
ncbi:MAG: SDR family NAD(P)-dependent oxidoreductase [Dehalococcoidia bacterium]|nr:SDR family NAD(P)-dependent oxidoreductase [Dehalococcoidia bacterium]